MSYRKLGCVPPEPREPLSKTELALLALERVERSPHGSCLEIDLATFKLLRSAYNAFVEPCTPGPGQLMAMMVIGRVVYVSRQSRSKRAI